MSEEIKVCTEIIISDNISPSGNEMALVSEKIWGNGKKLRVYFFPGDPFVQEKVKQYARVWEEFANISFEFTDDINAEIRVSFEPDGTSWSAIGKDALKVEWFPKDEPTMNYGWLTPDSEEVEFSRVIVHEFGHALGCIHEHQNPTDTNRIPWDEQAVYDYYAKQGWSKEKVDHNIFRKYAQNITRYTDFDDKSIMLYAIPNELTIGDYEVGWNTKLSEVDKYFIGEMYPKPQKP